PRLPGHVEPALGGVGEAFERLAVDRVDGDALAGGDDPDDAVAWQGMAAAGEMHGHPRDEAGDRHGEEILRLVAAGPPGAERHDLAGARLADLAAREDRIHDLALGLQAGADLGEEIVDGLAVKPLEAGLQRLVAEVVAVLLE